MNERLVSDLRSVNESVGSLGEPADSVEEAEQLAAAIRLSLEEAAERAEDFVLVEAPSSSTAVVPTVVVAPAPKALSARPRAKPKARAPKVQPRRYYVVTSVPSGDIAKLGIHFGKWDQVEVPGGTLAGSGWRLRVFDYEVEARAHWFDIRGDDIAPCFMHA